MQSTNQASTANYRYDHSHALEKVEALLQKAKEAAKQRENTLAFAFSQKVLINLFYNRLLYVIQLLVFPPILTV